MTAAPALTRAIRHLGGTPVSTAAYPATVDGLQRFLGASGVRHVSARELTRPHHADVARQVGYPVLLPPKSRWAQGAALALLADRIRDAAGTPITIRNWWRPEAYNRHPLVDGARRSDHLTAHSLDIDYPSNSAARKAERYLRGLDRDAPWLRLSLGLGARSTHVGLLSPLGRREWQYSGSSESP